MKALVKYAPGYGKLEVREVKEPEITKNQVLVEIKAAGICGSDVQHYEGRTKIKTPVILGHEFSGEIVKVGKKVKDWQVGDRIASETSAHICGICYYCKYGNYNLCSERKAFGSGVDGAFTKYIAVPARLLHRIPNEMSYDEAALVQPCADVVHAVTRNSEIFVGDTVVVLGPGPMGLLTTQVVKAQGAGRVIQTGHRGVRLNIAEKIGADITIPVEEEDPIKIINDLTDDRGADVVYEASGAASAAVQALDMVRKQGQIIIIGVHLKPIELNLRTIEFKELVLRGSAMSNWIDYQRAINLISSKAVHVKPIITHKFPITEWAQAFKLISKKMVGKVIFTPV